MWYAQKNCFVRNKYHRLSDMGEQNRASTHTESQIMDCHLVSKPLSIPVRDFCPHNLTTYIPSYVLTHTYVDTFLPLRNVLLIKPVGIA